MIRLIFPTLVFIHGLIHCMGGLKAFGISNMPISKIISKPAGLLWLCAAAAFVIAAQLIVVKKDWWLIGIAAIILSEALIISLWSDAKFGSVVNIIILIPAVINFANWQFRHSARQEAALLFERKISDTPIVKKEDISHLPPPVQKWLTRSGIIGKAATRTVRLKQKGSLRTSADGQWMPMHAEQYFTIDEPSFLWLAHIDYGISHISGKDSYKAGKGNMIIEAASLIPVANAKGKETDQGTMLRYLAEIQWFPSAALSPYITWTAKDTRSAIATMNYMGMTVSGTFFFNGDEDITAFEALRYMENKGKYSLETWFVPVSEYRSFEGIRVPSKGKAIWKLQKGDFSWFNWEITEISYNRPEVY